MCRSRPSPLHVSAALALRLRAHCPIRATRPLAGGCTATQPQPAPAIDWDAIRVHHLIPESGIELVPDDTYILEAGFERLHGVDFRKGCYVGQEVTARMKHKTELRKGLVRVQIDGAAPVGTEITAQDGKPVGTLFTQSGGFAMAHLRLRPGRCATLHGRRGPAAGSNRRFRQRDATAIKS